MRLSLLLPLLALCACPKAPDDPEPRPDDTARDDTGTSPDDTAPPAVGFSASTEVRGGGEGSIILRFTPVAADAAPVVFTVAAGEAFTTEVLPAGDYGLLAWLDEDGDGTWDGTWEGEGEATALLGVSVPRDGLHLVLRRGVPAPFLDDDPELVALYAAAWGFAEDHIAAGTAANGFADHYLDEAFCDLIFQWDSCFMVLFGLQGLDAFPVMPTLDDFYGTQAADGYICRVVNESDGQPTGDASNPAEPMINPPLFAWAELFYARRTGDLSRLPRVLPVLDAYAGWLDANVRTEPGLYYTSLLGSGMDNAPRDAAYDAWVDISAQQALARRALSELRPLLGEDGSADAAAAEAICADVRDLTWDADEGWFFDLDAEGAFLTDKTLAGVWPLVAGCATPAQTAAVIAHLTEPAEFWRVHPFPSTAADSPAYDPLGHYWRGGVWAPTTYVTIRALAEAGRRDLARAAADHDLRNLAQVYADFTPASGQLAPDHEGDGSATLWELYAPDSVAPGTRWDATYLGRQDFVGWTGLGPIATLLEQVIGLEPDAQADTLTLHLSRTDRHGVEGYRFGDQLVDLEVEARSAASAPATIRVTTSDAFTLVVESAGVSSSFDLDRGDATVTFDPSGATLAAATVPAGPFPGYAVLGNGSMAAVYSDDDGSGDPPGLLHLYRGDLATDLLELGQTLVGQGGVRVTGRTVGLDPFFAAYSEVTLAQGARLAWRAFVGEPDAVVIEGALVAGEADSTASVAPLVQLREQVHMDGGLAWSLVGRDASSGALWAELDDGRALALGASPTPTAWQTGTVTADPVAGGLTNSEGQGRQLALALDLSASAGTEAPFRWVLAVGDDRATALATLAERLAAADPLGEAATHWASFAPGSLCAGPFCETAAANLYAARASSLGGAVPADLTGQFVTHDRPQLYPRDALMVARALTATGHAEEAWEIVQPWLDPALERAAPGITWARYDALYRAVDSGSGADYDVREWDSAGYLALAVEALGPERLSAAQREVLLEGLDYLVAQQDADGLWTEGGIVEREGRLPSTTMTSWAGLDAGARLAERWGEDARAADYRAAAGMLRGGLMVLLDWDAVALMDEYEGALTWNSSLLFGPVLGFPADPVLDATDAWLLENARGLGGGMRYFDHVGYGRDLFGFTTAAAAQHAATLGDTWTASELLDWMAAFSNRYGLFPERIYEDGSGAAEASPLSWCAAETAMAVLRLEEVEDLPLLPTVDGALDPAEYRALGPCALDHDGLPDEAGDPVALYAVRAGADLYVGLQTAAAPDPASWLLWLAPASGDGALTSSDAGLPLTFRADPAVEPGAAARVALAAAVVGERALEIQLDLASLGLSGPVQLIAESLQTGALLPAHGALLTDGDDGSVLVTFEVAAEEGPVTLSGDRAELGAWAGHAVALEDRGDGTWSTTVALSRGGTVAYKYLLGEAGDPSWDGVEFEGEDRVLYVEDVDGSGRVGVAEVFGVRGGEVLDP
ncbi:MAG: trehalase family glycosidase [Pseudomonadota bacterium]